MFAQREKKTIQLETTKQINYNTFEKKQKRYLFDSRGFRCSLAAFFVYLFKASRLHVIIHRKTSL